MCYLEKIVQVFSDQYMFPILQGLLFFVLVLSLFMEFRARKRAGFGDTKLTVTRSPASMNIYYGMYAAISGVLVALCLSVDYAKDHKVLWVAIDIFISSYLCLFNTWFRLKLQDLSTYLTKVEAR
jgi:hypothetical protein